MTTFTIDDSDLDEIIRRDLWRSLRHQGVFPAVALVAATVLVWVHPMLGAVALGMGIAWTYSLVAQLRAVRPWYRSRHGSLAGPLTVEFEADGLRTEMPLGTAIVRWDQLSSVENYPGHFVLESDGEEILILPKRHFTTEELAILQSKASEAHQRRQNAG